MQRKEILVASFWNVWDSLSMFINRNAIIYSKMRTWQFNWQTTLWLRRAHARNHQYGAIFECQSLLFIILIFSSGQIFLGRVLFRRTTNEWKLQNWSRIEIKKQGHLTEPYNFFIVNRKNIKFQVKESFYQATLILNLRLILRQFVSSESLCIYSNIESITKFFKKNIFYCWIKYKNIKLNSTIWFFIVLGNCSYFLHAYIRIYAYVCWWRQMVLTHCAKLKEL